ncbi:MAG: ferrochelatase [Gammaproteobacteria bacterium]|nr:ferrochelatase [Gammaproteobacteria bacterium]
MGVLLANLGSPAAPTAAAVRRYLAEFLWDPRVVETPRWLWWLVLHGVILRTRPRRSARLYQRIWTEQGSPLLDFSRRQALALEKLLQKQNTEPVRVALAMRYGAPAIAVGLDDLRRSGMDRLLVLPLYPQYSATTTASTFDAVTNELQTWRRLPEVRFINHYYTDPGYIEAIAASIRKLWWENGEPDRLLFSFHGLPQRYILAGDPYFDQCQRTAQLAAENLKLPNSRWGVSFQSRMGREEWLRPYTDHLLREWGAAGVAGVDVICPGFSADCLETLEEIAMQNRELFLHAGGQRYRYVPALNDTPQHIQALASIAQRHLHAI